MLYQLSYLGTEGAGTVGTDSRSYPTARFHVQSPSLAHDEADLMDAAVVEERDR